MQWPQSTTAHKKYDNHIDHYTRNQKYELYLRCMIWLVWIDTLILPFLSEKQHKGSVLIFVLMKRYLQRKTKKNPFVFTDFRLNYRLLVQLEETETNFETLWEEHERKLQQCLDLRRFENEFKQVGDLFM